MSYSCILTIFYSSYFLLFFAYTRCLSFNCPWNQTENGEIVLQLKCLSNRNPLLCTVLLNAHIWTYSFLSLSLVWYWLFLLHCWRESTLEWVFIITTVARLYRELDGKRLHIVSYFIYRYNSFPFNPQYNVVQNYASLNRLQWQRFLTLQDDISAKQ